MIPLDSRPRLAPHVRLQIDRVTSQPVLLFPEGVLELNESAHAIVARCDGASTTAEIVAALAAEFEADESQLSADVLKCLDDLQRRQLVALAP
jgi:pyrroloquinoline quinone biosynthesis protein D